MNPQRMRLHAAFTLCTALLSSRARAEEPIEVVATITDLASIATAVGGDHVRVSTIAAGVQDPHFVDPKPSHVLKLRDAEVLLLNGLDLEVGWLPSLVESARNSRIRPGGAGHVDCSKNVPRLEIPRGTVTRAEGDVHPLGNPHYLTDPLNAKIVAGTIATALARARPALAAGFDARAKAFQARIDQAMPRWFKKMEPLRGAKVVFHHKSYSYFVARFGLVAAGVIELRAGIQPGPSHLSELTTAMLRDKIKIVATHPFYDVHLAQSVARRAGARLVTLPLTVGGVPAARDYFGFFDFVTTALAQAPQK